MKFGKFDSRQILLTILISYAVLVDKPYNLFRVSRTFVLFLILLYVSMLKLYLYYKKRKINQKQNRKTKIYNVTDWETNDYNIQYFPVSKEAMTHDAQ